MKTKGTSKLEADLGSAPKMVAFLRRVVVRDLCPRARLQKLCVEILTLVLSAAALRLCASAQVSPPRPKDGVTPMVAKVGTINIEQAVLATNEGQREFEALRKKLEPKQNELKSQNDEIERLQQQLKSDKNSGAARTSLANQIETKKKSLDHAVQDAQDEAQNQQKEVFQRILQKMAPGIVKYAQDNGFSMMVDTSNSWPQSPVLWYGEGSDTTKAVVAAYDGSPAEPVSAAARSTGGTGKIAVINIDQAISSSREGRQTLQGVRNENDQKKITQSIIEKMAPSLIKFAQGKGIGILIDISKPWPQSPILWFANQADVSQSFVDVYDRQETAQKSSSAPAAPAATLDTATPPPASAYASAAPPTIPNGGPLPAQAQSTTAMQIGPFYGLIIGIDHYSNLRQLHNAVNDARTVASVLHGEYGFETQLLLDATRSQIMTALSRYRRTLSSDANLLIYYAGHGHHDRDSDRIYWMPVDAELESSANWLLTDDVTSEIRAIPARHVLVVADSCYAGGMSRDIGNVFAPRERKAFLEKMATGKSRNLLSSGGDEPVTDAGGAGGHSRFAAALLEGLRNMQDQPFTATELWAQFIQVAVAGNSEQTPEYSYIHNSGHRAGDFVFLRHKP
ncbi:MAG TPA: OmpH family outer membrane protein [Candidatus Acidoferrum sp.]|jgi:Skp family chaperone for outer membrane proteins|nr:OmpH family outer membrane protein [Candidatus Acidoferrum sp.]